MSFFSPCPFSDVRIKGFWISTGVRFRTFSVWADVRIGHVQIPTDVKIYVWFLLQGCITEIFDTLKIKRKMLQLTVCSPYCHQVSRQDGRVGAQQRQNGRYWNAAGDTHAYTYCGKAAMPFSHVSQPQQATRRPNCRLSRIVVPWVTLACPRGHRGQYHGEGRGYIQFWPWAEIALGSW